VAWLDIKWQLNAWRFNESDDEQGLQFAILVTNPARSWVGVQPYETGNMSALATQAFGGRINVPATLTPDRGWVGIPDASKPYFALVVRAIEYDNSSATNRTRDFNNFVTGIRERAQAVVAAGGFPSEDQLTTWGRAARLEDRRWKDDDDNIGTAAFVFPTFGSPVTEAYYAETRPGLTSLGFLRLERSVRLSGEDALWDFNMSASVLTGEPDSPDYDTQERGGWWFFEP
jgi:hypothetical protein